MRIQNKIKRLRKQNKRLDEIQNISRFRGFVEGRILLSHTRGGGGGADGGKGQRVEAKAEGRGQRAKPEAETLTFFSLLPHIVKKWDYDREVIFLFLFCICFVGF